MSDELKRMYKINGIINEQVDIPQIDNFVDDEESDEEEIDEGEREIGQLDKVHDERIKKLRDSGKGDAAEKLRQKGPGHKPAKQAQLKQQLQAKQKKREQIAKQKERLSKKRQALEVNQPVNAQDPRWGITERMSELNTFLNDVDEGTFRDNAIASYDKKLKRDKKRKQDKKDKKNKE